MSESNLYSKLLLTTGGGIISEQQQAEQERNTASVIIGLGGTGISAIRTLKTQVYERLKPDNPAALIPTYQHIAFVGVDTDKRSSGIIDRNSKVKSEDMTVMPLDVTEFFDIGNKDIGKVICNANILSRRKELAWVNKRLSTPNLLDDGAGGIRQVGRLMLIDKAQSFKSKIEAALMTAMTGLSNPSVYIHIFSGLSGGTGSGCFLDACYLIRKLLAVKNLSATIFGYFYLPDVNLDKVPVTKPNVRDYIPVNGYAAMSELDYCMQIPGNGGSFKQYYQNIGDVEWNCAPVDMCHLICATNEHGDVIANAYDYAMNVSAEYVMDFLTRADDEVNFGLSSQLANFREMVIQGNAKKRVASSLEYCVIGASCSYVPMREINTYLAAEVFDKFSEQLKSNTPSEFDCKKLAADVLTRNREMTTEDQMFNALWREMRKGASDDYGSFPGDWRMVRDSGNNAIVTHYTNQMAAKRGTVETNCRSLKEGNTDSLVNRFRTSLESVLIDINRGPSFAYRMLAASTSHNLFNIIDGVIEINANRWKQEAAQEELRVTAYDMALAEFKRKPSKKRFEEYEHSLKNRMQHDLAMSNYQQMEDLLRKLKKQLETLAENYYLKLDRVMSTLIRTFDENKKALASEEETLRVKSTFAVPMMTVSELSKTLDERIRKLNIPNVLNAFVSAMVSNEDTWIQENERNISKFVINFFVNNLFRDFAGRTITEFLEDKYGLDSKAGNIYEQLTNQVYDEYIDPLTQHAKPLFYFNNTIWDSDQINSLAYVSVPTTATAIVSAAERKEKADSTWRVKKSALTDRIFVMYSACVLPFSSYNNVKNYEELYNNGNKTGIHYYEGTGMQDNDFCDWRDIPSLIPYSYMKPIDEIESLYQLATKYDVLNDQMDICAPSDEEIKTLEALINKCEQLSTVVITPDKISECTKLADQLKEYKFSTMMPTGEFFNNDGSPEEELRESLRKEHFYLEPSHRIKVKAIIDKIDAIALRAKVAEATLRKKMNSVLVNANDFSNYSEALFAGVFKISGRNISYIQDDLGLETEHILTKPSPEFPFNSIPMYQAYVTYQSLPGDMKSEIRTRTDEIIDTDPDTLKNGITAVTIMLERINAFKSAAARFEQKAEIESFLTDLNKKFKTEFCPLYGN